MEIRLLEYFMAVCQELHFTKAAEKLGVSQPTLSHQIRLLEDRLGTPLFRRIGKKIYITQAGKILLEHVDRIFFELRQATTKIKEIQGLLRGKLTIGCSGNHLITSAVISFHKKYPDIELSVVDLSTEETIDRLFLNELDIGITFLPRIDDQIESIFLFDEEFCFVTSIYHELVDSPCIQLERLGSLELVLMPKKYLIRQFIEKICQEASCPIQPRIELSTMESLHQMVRNNNTVATILPKSYLQSIHDPQIRQIPIVEPTPSKKVGVIYRKDVFIDITMEAFIKQLIETYR